MAEQPAEDAVNGVVEDVVAERGPDMAGAGGGVPGVVRVMRTHVVGAAGARRGQPAHPPLALLTGDPRPQRVQVPPGRRRGVVPHAAPLAADFLSRGTHPVGGVPGWFTTSQPGRWAYLPGWQRAAVRWAAVAIAAGLYTRPRTPPLTTHHHQRIHVGELRERR